MTDPKSSNRNRDRWDKQAHLKPHTAQDFDLGWLDHVDASLTNLLIMLIHVIYSQICTRYILGNGEGGGDYQPVGMH